MSYLAGGSNSGRQRTTRPIVTGTSVLGVTYRDGVMLAADTLCSYGSMAKYKDVRRLVVVNDKTVMGGGGELSDFQCIVKLLERNALETRCTSASLYDEEEDGPRETWNYLRAVMYNRRNKMDPLWNDLVIAGYDAEAKKPFLATVDKIGTAFTVEDVVCTGFGGYLATPLLREKWRPDLEEGEARALLEDCMRVLFYRDCRASNRIQIAKVSTDGSAAIVSDPYEIEHNWDSPSFVAPKAAFDGDGGF